MNVLRSIVSRRVIAIAVALAAVSAPLLTPVSVHAGGVYRLLSLAAWKAGYNRCMWAPNASKGTQMELFDCYPGYTPEDWNIIDVGIGVHLLQNQYSGLCLDLYGNNQHNGTPAVQWGPCSSADQAQVFVVGAYGNSGCPSGLTSVIIENEYNSRLFLDDHYGSPNEYNPIDFWQQNSTDAQSWCLRSA